eukprot:10399-Hanusia_phi.AAC.4
MTLGFPPHLPAVARTGRLRTWGLLLCHRAVLQVFLLARDAEGNRVIDAQRLVVLVRDLDVGVMMAVRQEAEPQEVDAPHSLPNLLPVDIVRRMIHKRLEPHAARRTLLASTRVADVVDGKAEEPLRVALEDVVSWREDPVQLGTKVTREEQEKLLVDHDALVGPAASISSRPQGNGQLVRAGGEERKGNSESLWSEVVSLEVLAV